MTDYTKIENEVNVQAEEIWYMAFNVWEFAELGYEEKQSAAYEQAVLEMNVFEINKTAQQPRAWT